jgi:hypothetical protein
MYVTSFTDTQIAFIQFADVDCSWSDTYHAPGAAGRLREAAERYELKGFTHYVKSDTEWFASDEGLAFFETAAELKLIASLALGPQWQPALRELARRFPTVPFLCHHMPGLASVIPNVWRRLPRLRRCRTSMSRCRAFTT